MSPIAEKNIQSAPQRGIIDEAALLKPISEDAPAGEYLVFDEVYQGIDEARRSDDRLARGHWQRKTLKSADWQMVSRLATEALATRTKDLQVAAWLMESLIKLHGFAGFRDGLRVMRGLHENFWDEAYPQIVLDEGLEARAKIIEWLNRQLGVALMEVPLTKGSKGEKYSYLQYKSAGQAIATDESDEEESDEDAAPELKNASDPLNITVEQWRAAQTSTPYSFYEQLSGQLEECGRELNAFDEVLDQKFVEEKNGKTVNNSPGLRNLKQSLEEVSSFVEKLAREKRPPGIKAAPKTGASKRKAAARQEEVAEENLAPTDMTAGDVEKSAAPISYADAASLGAQRVIASRDEALGRLDEVAQYFRQAEPHSPVSYLVQRAIKWGRMPLDAWLEDVMGEDPMLNKMLETLGLKSAQGGTSNDAERSDEDEADDVDNSDSDDDE
jgi:type VI secretion system protein ImpA